MKSPSVDSSEISHFFIIFCFCQDQADEDIDWWSKFYASVGDHDKAGVYLEKGYDKIMVRDLISRRTLL